MSARRSSGKKIKSVYIICAAVVVAALGLIYGIHRYNISQVAPVYVMKVEGLACETPAEAQAACRGDYAKFAETQSGYDGCAWVWTGEDSLYLVKSEALELNPAAEETGFTAVTFLNPNGKRLGGWVIDPATEPVELGRIEITDGGEYTFENVSMTVRVGIRNGEISYENAVYLWEKDSDTVLAVRPDTYKAVEGSIVSFTDDGNVTHTCYILDTAV